MKNLEILQDKKQTIEKNSSEFTPEQIEEITQEKEWVEQNFQEIINKINKRYEKSPILSENQKSSYQTHNKEILNFSIERAVEKNLDEIEKAMLYFAAIYHDSTKGDEPPETKKHIKNYTLVKHGESAGKEARAFLESEEGKTIINKILAREKSPNYNKEQIIAIIENSIKRHMGPHQRSQEEKENPAFMDIVQDAVNSQLPKEERIAHPCPENKIDKILFAADMRSLAGPEGAQKILDIRSNVPNFKEEDKIISQKCQEQGIDLTPADIAFLSAFESAEQACSSVDEENQEWVGRAIKKLKNGIYYYSEEKTPIDINNVLRIKKENAKTLQIIKNDVQKKIREKQNTHNKTN